MSREVHLLTWGKPLFQAIAVRSPGIDVNEFRRAYQPLIAQYIIDGRLDVIPEANYRALDALIALEKRIVLLTSRTEDEVRHMLAPDHQLARRVTDIYHKDRTAFHKPDPRVFDELLREQGISPNNVVYVGDSVTDAQATQGRGIPIIVSLESGLRQRQDFAGYRVAAYIARFPEVVAVVRTIDRA